MCCEGYDVLKEEARVTLSMKTRVRQDWITELLMDMRKNRQKIVVT